MTNNAEGWRGRLGTVGVWAGPGAAGPDLARQAEELGLGAVWVTSQETGELLRVDPGDDQPSLTVAIGQSPDGVAVG